MFESVLAPFHEALHWTYEKLVRAAEIMQPQPPLFFDLPHRYDDSGLLTEEGRAEAERMAEEAKQSPYYRVQQPFWRRIHDARDASLNARAKLDEELITHWQTRWPSWSEQDIREMRDQFRSIDLNGDGTLDLDEVETVVKSYKAELGREEILDFFREIDVDNSGAVDFEEFLQLVYRITHGKIDVASTFGKAYSLFAPRAHLAPKLTPEQCVRFRLI